MRTGRFALAALVALMTGCGRDKEHLAAPQATATAQASASQGEGPLLSERGYLWVVPGPECSAVIVSRADEWSERKGELYLWRREEEFGGARGYYRHIPLEGPARLDGISWSPNGTALAFYEEVDDQYRLCHVKVEEYQVRHIAKQGVSPWGSKAWSPDSRYLAFVQRSEDGDQLRCFPKDTAMAPVFDKTWETYEVFDLAAPVGQTISHLRWAPDSSKLVGAAYVGWADKEYGLRTSDASMFLTWPGAKEPQIMWQDEELKDHIPAPHWADGGKVIVFHLASSLYGHLGRLLAIRPDGTDLRVLWEESEVQRSKLSPDGRHALLWLLQSWRDGAPEPDRMAAVNVVTGATKLYEDAIVALDPQSRHNGVEQSIEWAEDGSSVSLIVTTRWIRRDFRRVTLELP